MASENLRRAALKSPRQLFKFLMRECEKLPKEAQNFYKHSIKQSFKQHVVEPDKERVQQIMEKAMQDAEWIVKKYTKPEGTKAQTK